MAEVHNIGPGSLYDQPIPAGQQVLTLDTPSNQHQPTSMSLTVEPGQTYAVHRHPGSDQGVYSAGDRDGLPSQSRRNPSSGKTGSDLGMSTRIIQVRAVTRSAEKRGWEVSEELMAFARFTRAAR